MEFDLAANGIIGLETSLSLGLKLVHDGLITMECLLEKMSKNPAVFPVRPGFGGLIMGVNSAISLKPLAIFRCPGSQSRG